MAHQQTSVVSSRLVCAGCGAEAHDPSGPRGAYPFRCPHAHAGDDVDHVVTRVLDPTSVRFPLETDPNPFVRYRTLFRSHHLARARGMTDGQYVALVRVLDDEIARTEDVATVSGSPARGRGFQITPFGRDNALSERFGSTAEGGVWVKDETRNVAGSHKGRHLMGIMIYLQVLDALGLTRAPLPPLAIASCGNAALAAAVVARAARRPLDVYIPQDAPSSVVTRLRQLEARTIICKREPGTTGDPCYHRFQQAIEGGAIPFCCQGTANGLTIEGGETLGYEMIPASGSPPIDAVVVQVGGGALASAVIQSFTDAVALGACARSPRVYTVQTRGAFPLKRAYDRFVAGGAGPQIRTSGSADLQVRPTDLQIRLRYALTHRHEFMWPWEDEPRSIARGILDDETYDWGAVVRGMLQSGGRPIVVEEHELVDAYTLAHAVTDVDVDHTGAAGLAGLLQLGRDGTIKPHEKVAVIFSGAQRA